MSNLKFLEQNQILQLMNQLEMILKLEVTYTKRHKKRTAMMEMSQKFLHFQNDQLNF